MRESPFRDKKRLDEEMSHRQSYSGVRSPGLWGAAKRYMRDVVDLKYAKEGIADMNALMDRAVAGDTDAAIELGLNFTPGAIASTKVAGKMADMADDIVSGHGDDLVTLYHGTSKDGANGIRADGRINSGSYFGGIDGVALTPRIEMAKEYANGGEVITVRVPKSRLVVDPESYDDILDIDEAIKNGASVYATGPVLLGK